MITAPIVAALQSPLRVVVGTSPALPALFSSRYFDRIVLKNYRRSPYPMARQVRACGIRAARITFRRRLLAIKGERRHFFCLSAGLACGVTQLLALVLVLVNSGV